MAAATEVVPGLHRVSLGIVNAYLLQDDGRVTIIDTGTEGSEEQILAAVEEVGYQPRDVKRILLTHCHADHSGSLAQLKRRTGARAAMHGIDAGLVRRGAGWREAKAAPGLANQIVVRLFKPEHAVAVPAAEIEREVSDREVLDIGGGLEVVHLPGHCAGQVGFLWRRQGVFIAGDVAGNMVTLGYPIIFEDLEEGKRSLRKVGTLEFDVAVFGHGGPIKKDAAKRFRRKWGTL